MAAQFPNKDKDMKCYREIRYVIAVAKDGRNPGEIRWPNAVAIDTNTNRIYIVEGMGPRISIFSDTGVFLNTFKFEEAMLPYGIAIHQDNIYITDIVGHYIHHFKVPDIRFVSKVGGKGSGTGQFNDPLGIAASTNGDVYVADQQNDRIQILDKNLIYQRSISHDSIKRPKDIKLTRVNVHILSVVENGSPCIHILSYSGDKIRSLITCGDDMQVMWPTFFCIDDNNNLILNDITNQIKIFSNEGALIHTIGGIGSEVGMFYNTQGVAFTNDLKLVVVSENPNYGLQIF